MAFDPIPLDALAILTLGFYFLTFYVSASFCSTLLVKFAFIKFSSYFMEISLVKVQIVCFLGKLTWMATFVVLDQFGPINSPPLHYLLFVPNERYATDPVKNKNPKCSIILQFKNILATFLHFLTLEHLFVPISLAYTINALPTLATLVGNAFYLCSASPRR